jgi:hypothetical protein
MSDQPRDWDRELADIDRLMAKQGGAPAGGMAPAPVPTPRGAPVPGPAPVRRRSVALTWFWVGLAVALGAALVLWPYQKACGLQLFFFLGAAGVTLIVGALGAINSWAHRRGFAHMLSLLVMLWAGVVAARETLPRVGYAKDARTWTCQAAPASAPVGQTPPAQPAPSSQAAPPSAPPSTTPAKP